MHVPCRKVRLTLDTAKVEGWNEIDAVGLLGTVSGHAPPPSRSELGKPATTMATTMATTVATTVEEFEELILQIESRRGGADPWVLEALKDWLLELRRIGSQLYEN